MDPVSELEQKNCWPKKCEIWIVSKKSKIVRIPNLEIANEKEFAEIAKSNNMNSN